MAVSILKSGGIQNVGMKQLVLLAEALCAILLFALILKIGFLFFKPGGSQVIAPTNANTVISNSPVPDLDRSILSEFDPFHRDSPEILIVQSDSAPETTLDLKVFGMRADLKGDSSSAIIETPDNNQSTFFIGDEIIPGVTLKEVDIDFVILDRNGKSERLSRQGRTEDEVASGSTVSLNTLSFSAAQMIKDVRLYPYRQDKQVIGYQVRPQRSSKAKLEQYGFKTGDVVTSINGESLSQPQVNLPALYKNLKLARYANIQIIRDDVPMTIEVNLK